jgi:peroxiredoxin
MTVLDLTYLGAQFVLAGVFLLAGLSKLFDRAGSRQALMGFGVPETLARSLAVLLPMVECVVAVSLLNQKTVWLASLGALSLLTLFVVAIALNLAQGRRPSCHCFGQIHSTPVSWSTLSRNVILAAMAAFMVSYTRGPVDLGIEDVISHVGLSQVMGAAIVSCGVLLPVSVFLLMQIIRQQGRILLRLDAIENRQATPTSEFEESVSPGLPIGSRAPAFNLKDLQGEDSSLESWLKLKKPVLLFFTHPGCGPCNSLLPDISRWHRQSVERVSMVLISEGTTADNLAKDLGGNGPPVLLQRDREVAEAYHAYGTPAVVLVRPDGTIGSPLVMGAESVREATVRAIGPSSTRNGDERGTPNAAAEPRGDELSSMRLQDTAGRTLLLASLLGTRSVVLLFWNPDCGFCQKMYPELKRWDAHERVDGSGLVVISSGTIDQNRAMQLRSPVLSDPELTLSALLGVQGTPMAVLVDADGRIASPVAVGQEDVLALGTSQLVH